MFVELDEEDFGITEGVDAPGTYTLLAHEGRILVGGITESLEFSIYCTGEYTPFEHISDLIATDPTFTYQEGNCYELATVLQHLDRVTGYAQLVDSDTGDMVHTLAVLENGMLVDSLGIWDESDLVAFWDTRMEPEGISVECEYDELAGVPVTPASYDATYDKLQEIIAQLP